MLVHYTSVYRPLSLFHGRNENGLTSAYPPVLYPLAKHNSSRTALAAPGRTVGVEAAQPRTATNATPEPAPPAAAGPPPQGERQQAAIATATTAPTTPRVVVVPPRTAASTTPPTPPSKISGAPESVETRMPLASSEVTTRLRISRHPATSGSRPGVSWAVSPPGLSTSRQQQRRGRGAGLAGALAGGHPQRGARSATTAVVVGPAAAGVCLRRVNEGQQHRGAPQDQGILPGGGSPPPPSPPTPAAADISSSGSSEPTLGRPLPVPPSALLLIVAAEGGAPGLAREATPPRRRRRRRGRGRHRERPPLRPPKRAVVITAATPATGTCRWRWRPPKKGGTANGTSAPGGGLMIVTARCLGFSAGQGRGVPLQGLREPGPGGRPSGTTVDVRR